MNQTFRYIYFTLLSKWVYLPKEGSSELPIEPALLYFWQCRILYQKIDISIVNMSTSLSTSQLLVEMEAGDRA